MKCNTLLLTLTGMSFLIAIQGCTAQECCQVDTRTIAIYENQTIPANQGISTGTYTEVDGYRYANIVVEFEQDSADEEPVSLNISFAHDENGKWSSGRYFTFEENYSGSGPADQQGFGVTGENSWHGRPHNVSRYIARVPVMGPYLQVFPYNYHDEARVISVVIYLTE